MHAPRDVRLEGSAKATDAFIEVAATCVCGSALWPDGRAIRALLRP